MTVKRWETLDGKLNILANTSRWKFEYEEKRGWFVLKIREPSVEDDGLWKCRMVVWFGKSGVARRYESRKRINLKNKSDYFTFKVGLELLSTNMFLKLENVWLVLK